MAVITEKNTLWEKTPGLCGEIPVIESYIPEKNPLKAAAVILPGGAYANRAPHEGKDYAEFLAENGVAAFVAQYRVSPHRFPLPLLDARRAVRYARYHADQYGIDKARVAIMGSSAGGHLAALTSTYYEKIAFEGIDDIDKEDCVPNAQILCYPVIRLLGKGVAHLGSGKNLLGGALADLGEALTPSLIATEKTPPAFIWHTFDDGEVNVINSLEYAEAIKRAGGSAELHIFPKGRHGLGRAVGDDDTSRHVAQWGTLLLNWLKYLHKQREGF